MMRRTTFQAGTGQFVVLEPIDSRSVTVSSTRVKPVVSRKEELHNEIITQIQYVNVPVFEIGKQITVGKEPFRIEYIEESGSNFILHASKLTKASYFMFPSLGENRKYFLWNSQFVNAFSDIEDTKYEYPENCLYLLYRFSKRQFYARFEQKIQQNSLYLDMFDVDPFHVIYVFKVPSELHVEYQLFRKGLYSKLHLNYKQQILAFHGSSNNSPLAGILNRSMVLREKLNRDLATNIDKFAELHDPPFIMEETYLNKYKIKKVLQPNVEFT